MKKVDERMAASLVTAATSEREILIRCGKIKEVAKLTDSFQERDHSFLIIERPKEYSLRKCILKLGKTFLNESEVKKCIHKVLEIVK